MKSNFYVKLSIISFTLFFLISPFVKANPIVMGPSLGGLEYIFIFLPFLLIITIFMEFGTILLFLKSSILTSYFYKKVPVTVIQKNLSFRQMQTEKTVYFKFDLLKNVFFVNLFTFPITQLFVLFLMLLFPNLNYFYLTAEIIPISLEILLFLKIYQRYNFLGFLGRDLSLSKRIISILSANLISFGFGIVLSFMQIPYVFK